VNPHRFVVSLALAAFVSPFVFSPPVSAAQKPPAVTDAVLAKRFGAKLSVPITLVSGARSVKRTRRELGVRLDLAAMKAAAKNGDKTPLVLVVDKGAMKNALVRVAPQFAQPPRDARPFVYRGRVRIDKGAFGRLLNVPTTTEKFAAAFAKNPGLRRFDVSVAKKPPTLTAERLRGINGVIGTFSTLTSDNAKRNHNIALAAQRMDGTLLSPNETFSLNKAVGERTQANGFLTAHVFEDGEIVDGIGGGVSQATGTLFNAAALAGLKINEVHPHSRPIAYLPVGRDATVAFGTKDLRFTNDTSAPVYLSYTFRRPRLTATLFGKKAAGRRVGLRPIVQRRAPGDIRAQLYRIVKVRGKVVKKERLFSHQYKWEPDKAE